MQIRLLEVADCDGVIDSKTSFLLCRRTLPILPAIDMKTVQCCQRVEVYCFCLVDQLSQESGQCIAELSIGCDQPL